MIDVKMDWSVLEEKSSFKMLRLTFSSKLDWALTFYISIIAKTAKCPRKLQPSMILLIMFLSPRSLCTYRSTIQSYMECCYHVRAGAPSCAMWNCYQISFENGYGGLSTKHFRLAQWILVVKGGGCTEKSTKFCK